MHGDSHTILYAIIILTILRLILFVDSNTISNTFGICIIARILLALAAQTEYMRVYILPFLGIVSFVWVLMSVGIVQRDVGVEANGKIWWKNLRPVHALLYIFAFTALYSKMFRVSSWILFADILFGTIARYMYRGSII